MEHEEFNKAGKHGNMEIIRQLEREVFLILAPKYRDVPFHMFRQAKVRRELVLHSRDPEHDFSFSGLRQA